MRGLPLNLPIDADPQQQVAASPQVLVARSFSRYAVSRSVDFSLAA
jgi:hypothetical protein